MTAERRLDRLLRLRALQAEMAAGELAAARRDLRDAEFGVLRLRGLRGDEIDRQGKRLEEGNHEAWLFGLSETVLLEVQEAALRQRLPDLEARASSAAEQERVHRMEHKQIESMVGRAAEAQRASADRAEERRLGDQFLAVRLWQQRRPVQQRDS